MVVVPSSCGQEEPDLEACSRRTQKTLRNKDSRVDSLLLPDARGAEFLRGPEDGQPGASTAAGARRRAALPLPRPRSRSSAEGWLHGVSLWGSCGWGAGLGWARLPLHLCEWAGAEECTAISTGRCALQVQQRAKCFRAAVGGGHLEEQGGVDVQSQELVRGRCLQQGTPWICSTRCECIRVAKPVLQVADRSQLETGEVPIALQRENREEAESPRGIRESSV